ncbi:MAG TPA: MFS transporter [Ktedonobacterales bacterium]|nr:MFS transporter [Ktedonobacterales bacterium]
MARATGRASWGKTAFQSVRSRARGWASDLTTYPRNVYLLLLFTLGKGFQLSIAQVTTSLYAYSIGYKQDFVGVLIAVPAIGSLLAAPLVGYMADRLPRKPLLLVTGLLNPVALAVIGLTTDATVMLIAAFINGLLASAYWVTNIPMLTESVEPARRVSVMSLNTFLLLGIGALGAIVGGVVPEIASALTGLPATAPEPLRAGVVAAAIAVLLPTFPLFWLVEEPRGDMAAASAGIAGETASAGPAPSARPILVLFLLLLIPDVLYTAGEGAVVSLLPLFLELRFGASPAAIGALVAGAGLLSGVTALMAPAIVRRYGKLRVITRAQLLSVPVALLIGYAPILLVSGLAEGMRNVLRGFFEPVYATFAMERVDARYRSRLSGMYSVTWSLGFSGGAAAAGWLQHNVNLSIGFALGALLLGVAPLLLIATFGRDPTVD